MIDGMYTLTTDDLIHAIIIISTIHCVQATVLLHEQVNDILEMYQYVMKAGI